MTAVLSLPRDTPKNTAHWLAYNRHYGCNVTLADAKSSESVGGA